MEEKKQMHGSGDQKQIFQSYLAKFMCNASDANVEGSARTSRFVFYNVDENEHLEPETNFNETLPRETSNFISEDDLDWLNPYHAESGLYEPPSERDKVRAYAT